MCYRDDEIPSLEYQYTEKFPSWRDIPLVILFCILMIPIGLIWGGMDVIENWKIREK